MRYLIVCFCFLITGCTGIPDGIKPVDNFEVSRYLGTWYEIARLDHSFERGLQNVTAQYSTRADGGIKVMNRGFDVSLNEWSEAEGKAYFVGDKTIGHLKVSFFGPFYGSYIIFDLGEDYDYSLVTSSNKSYLWLLSRSPVMSEVKETELLKRITELGFDTKSLIFVKQSEESDGNYSRIE
ncbi:MAG: apolipoprotein D and lipocalin family protein [Flavobacteriales bacterium]|jgi:apolipoprotein D and lipocalin family protein